MKHDSLILPLYQFFVNLRANGFELGIDNYTLLIRAMQSGFGMESKKSLLWLCKTLWLKSKEREEFFDILFEDYFLKEQQRISWQAKQNNFDGISSEQEEHKKNEKKEVTSEQQLHEKNEIETKDKDHHINIHEKFITLSIEEVRTEAETLKIKHIGKFSNKFQLRGSYLPLTENELKVAWQFLRRTEEGTPCNILDIQSTVKKISEEGILFEPIFFKSEKNIFELFILIDHRGSMVPFHHFIRSIAQVASKNSHIKTRIYYFFNVPGAHLYKNTAHTDSDSLNAILLKLQKKNLL